MGVAQRSGGIALNYRVALVLVFAVMLAVASSARSQSTTDKTARGFFFDGNQLLVRCNNSPLFCRGYVAGIADVMSGTQAMVTGWRACLPSPVTVHTVDKEHDVVISFLTVHPEMRNEIAASLVAQALSEVFPCP
jgi:hypothetical protein